MKNLISLASAGVILLGLCSLCLAGNPRLAIEQPVFDFGQIQEGQKVSHIFRFSNQGDAPLLIQKVRSSCGCTGALLSAKEIPPGKSGEARITFNSNGMRGKMVKWIYLYSNDPVEKMARFQIRGTVLPEIGIRPSRIRLTQLKPGQPAQSEVILTNNSPRAVFLSNLKASSAAIAPEISATRLAPGETARLTVTVAMPADEKHLSGYVLLSTSTPHTPKLRIPVYGTCKNP
jgi:hypothetical protein